MPLTSTTPAPVIQPTFAGTLPTATDISGAGLSADGQTIYVAATEPVLDVGTLLNLHLPKIVGAAATLATFAALLWMLRRLKRRGSRATRHCPRCHYDVTALSTPRCPECGTNFSKRPPRRGTPPHRRLALPGLAIALILASAAWYYALGRRSYPAPFPTNRWLSVTLCDWGEHRYLLWMKSATTFGTTISELDAATGARRRVLGVRPRGLDFHAAAYVPAANAFLIPTPAGIEFFLLSEARTVATLAEKYPLPMWRSPEYFIGVSADSSHVWLALTDSIGAVEVAEWNWRAGQVWTVHRAELPIRMRSPAVRYMLLPGQPAQLLEVLWTPQDSRVPVTPILSSAWHADLTIYDSNGQRLAHRRSSVDHRKHHPLPATLQGRSIHLGTPDHQCVYSIDDLSETERASEDEGRGLLRGCQVAGNLLFSQRDHLIHVHALSDKRHLATLDGWAGLQVPDDPGDPLGPVFTSADNRTILTLDHARLLLWRLPEPSTSPSSSPH